MAHEKQMEQNYIDHLKHETLNIALNLSCQLWQWGSARVANDFSVAARGMLQPKEPHSQPAGR
jgi:hypothetical protein